MQAVKTLPTSIKEKRISRAEAPRIPLTKKNKRKKSIGIRRIISSSPLLILVTKVERSHLKCPSGASKCISALDRMIMKLQSKPGGCMSVKTKIFKGLMRVCCKLDELGQKFTGISICHPIYDDKAMTQVLRHAIYSAILNTEATVTFMFMPASGNLMITNPDSKILNAYPHLCCKLGMTSKVWNTTARVHLDNQSPTWLQGLAKDIPEAK
eukprot:1139642-Pelagomonas_calceolata.AAC.2